MFTGLIETAGTLVWLQPTAGAPRLLIAAPALQGRWRTGDSIAVNGVCLTAIQAETPGHFAADLAEETVQRTTLAGLQPGSTLNLELPTPAGSPLGGHVVQGHVDGVGTLVSLVPLGADTATADWRLTLELPSALGGYVLQQGSITIDGISLTVAKRHAPTPDGRLRLEVAVIPHTYRSTHLHTLAPGALLNIETDVLARYAAQAIGSPQQDWLTAEYLLANGY